MIQFLHEIFLFLKMLRFFHVALLNQILVLLLVVYKCLSELHNLFICLFGERSKFFLQLSQLIFTLTLALSKPFTHLSLSLMLSSNYFEFLLHLTHNTIVLNQNHLDFLPMCLMYAI